MKIEAVLQITSLCLLRVFVTHLKHYIAQLVLAAGLQPYSMELLSQDNISIKYILATLI